MLCISGIIENDIRIQFHNLFNIQIALRINSVQMCIRDSVWTLHMNNRDTIRIRSALTVTPIHTYRYDSQNADLTDSRALQSLIDQLARETNHKDVVAIELPAVTYDAPLILHSRSFSLTGTETCLLYTSRCV